MFFRYGAQLRKDPTWRPQGRHHADIFTIDYCPPNQLATGAADGQILVWNTNLMKTVAQFTALPAGTITGPLNDKVPVDKVLWLRSRCEGASSRRARVGNLVSSAHGGFLHIWNSNNSELLCKFQGSKLKTGEQVCTAALGPCARVEGWWGLLLLLFFEF